MFWTVLALLLWVPLGGFISYYGDLQGRRWGKRKVSWFGLRPKYTAIIITGITGALISLLSIVVLLLVAPAVRNVILNGERAIDDNKRLNATLTADRVQATNTLKEINNRLALTTANLNAQKQDLDEKLAQLKETDRAYQNAQRRNTDLQKEQARLETTLQEEQAKVTMLAAKANTLTATAARLSRQAKDLNQTNGRLTYVNTEFARQNEDLTRKNGDARRINANLTTSNDKLSANVRALQGQESDLRNQVAILERSNATQLVANQKGEDDYRERQRELQSKINALEGQQDQLVTRLAGAGQTFSEAYSVLRRERVSIRAGAELARRTIDAHLRPEAIQEQLTALLDEASGAAAAYKAARGDNNRAVRIVTKRVIMEARTEDANEEASLRALADYLSGSNAPTVVVANALTNSIEGEQVLIELTPHSVSEVFPKGSVVATQQIAGRQPYSKTLDSINRFLQTDVRNAAIRAGCVPQIDPVSGTPQIGRFALDDLAELTERVRRAGGDVTLKAIASAPITSADSLDSTRLRFEVSRSPGI